MEQLPYSTLVPGEVAPSFPDLCVFRITVYRTTLEHRLSAWPGSMFIMDLSNTTVGTTLENTL